jgi:hypothetical protein
MIAIFIYPDFIHTLFDFLIGIRHVAPLVTVVHIQCIIPRACVYTL